MIKVVILCQLIERLLKKEEKDVDPLSIPFAESIAPNGYTTLF